MAPDDLVDPKTAETAYSPAARKAAAPASTLNFIKHKPTQRQRRLAFGIGGALFAAMTALVPFAQTPWLSIPGFIVFYATAAFILDLLVGLLLLSKGAVESNRGHLLLAIGFLYAGLVALIYLTTFPGALVPGILLGTSGSAGWLWVFWHGGFAAIMTYYGLFAGSRRALPQRPFTAVCIAALLAAIAGVAGFAVVPHISPAFDSVLVMNTPGGRWTLMTVITLNYVAAGLISLRFRGRSAEHLWLSIGLIGACADVCLTAAGGHRFSLGWYVGRFCGISTSFVMLMSLLNDVLHTYGSVAAANDVLDRMSMTDALTGLGNRRMFDTIFNNEWRRCRRESQPLTVVMIDVDEFKSYNDTYGHQAGDDCLRRIGHQIAAATQRPSDLAARYGGEEFALVLPGTDVTGAKHVANRVRLSVRQLEIANRAASRPFVTVSAGIAMMVPSDNLDMMELLHRADMALYKAKAAGRDMVLAAS